jgi:hypothetical protein
MPPIRQHDPLRHLIAAQLGGFRAVGQPGQERAVIVAPRLWRDVDCHYFASIICAHASHIARAGVLQYAK